MAALPTMVKLPAGIDPSDPSWAVVNLFDEVHKKTLGEMAALVRALSSEVAASAALAEKSAQKRAEVTISTAGVWAGDQLRKAGSDAAGEVLRETEGLITALQQLNRMLLQLGFICVGICVAAGGLLGLELLRLFWH